MDNSQSDFILSSADGRYHYELALGDVALIGRGMDADLRLTEQEVSRRHATIVAESGGLSITDQGSGWGTLVDGRRISGTTTVRPEQTIEIGPVLFRLLSPAALTAANSETARQHRVASSSTGNGGPFPPPAEVARATDTPPDKSRLGRTVALIGVAAAVLSAVVALLVYLTGLPTATEKFQNSVDLWCAAGDAGRPKWDAALSDFEWDPDQLRRIAQDVEVHDKRVLKTFRELAPPAELQDAYTATESSLAALVEVDVNWMKRIQKMSDRQIRAAEPPRVPGTPPELGSLGAEFSTNLTNLSGNSENCGLKPTG